jgi:hydroxyacylglutathione hydrolase
LSQDSPIKAKIIPVTAFQQNCSIIWCTETKRGALIDPGGEAETLIAEIQARDIAIEKILVTHGHIDHVGAVAELAQHFGVPIEGPHPEDRFLTETVEEQGARFGIPGRNFEPDRWLDENDVVTVGSQSFAVRHCPGHTPGHVVFVHEAARLAFVGDVLFQGSVGRTDVPYGNHASLINAIRTKLLPLGDDFAFICGHGPASTIGRERRSNPFIAVEDDA